MGVRCADGEERDLWFCSFFTVHLITVLKLGHRDIKLKFNIYARGSDNSISLWDEADD